MQRELGVTDELILDAIKTHTYYGDSQFFNDPHCWCLRFSDILEPTRDWSGEHLLLKCAKRLKELVYARRMAEGAFLQTGTLIKWYKSKGVPVHPNMDRVKQELAAKLNKPDPDAALSERVF